MKNKRWKIAGGLCLLLLVLVCVWLFFQSGTKGEAEEGKKTEKPVEIRITYATGDATWNAAVEMAASEFMKQNTDVVVTLLNNGTDAKTGMYTDYLKREIATDSLGDIVEIRDKSMFEGTKILSSLPKELTDLVQCQTAEDGSIYVLPENIATQGILYNKDLFDKLNLKEPETYGEFLDICEKLKIYKLTPVVVGAKDTWHMGFWINHFFRTDILSQNEEWEKQCTKGEVAWTDSAMDQMIADLQTLFEQGYVNEDYLSVSDSETAFLMAEGNVGMLYSGPWMFQKIQEIDSSVKLGWFFLPDASGQKYAFLDSDSGWGITTDCQRDSRKYQAAERFLSFFFSEEMYGKICSYTNGIPSTTANIDLSDNQVLEEVQNKMQDHVIFMEHQIGDADTPQNFRNIMYQQFFALVQGKLTRQEYLADMQAQWMQCKALEDAAEGVEK